MTKTESPLETALADARALLADPGNWCRGSVARTAAGKPTGPLHHNAAKWSGIGAIVNAAPGRGLLLPAWNLLSRIVGGEFETWQDDPQTTHKSLMVAFNAALIELRKLTPAEPQRAVVEAEAVSVGW